MEQKIAAQQESLLEAIRGLEAVKVVETVREVQTTGQTMAADPVKAAQLNNANTNEQANTEEKSVGGVSPQLVAAITGAIAVYLDDQDMERYSISSIQATT